MSFVSRNINDPGVIEELKGRGFQTFPVTFVDGKGYAGYNPVELSAALGIAVGKIKKSATTGEMYGRMDRVLAALSAVTLQFPVDRLSHPGGIGRLTMIAYPHVIARHVKVTMRARNSGVWEPKYHFKNRGWRKLKDPQSMARYVEGVRKRFQHWSATLTNEELDMPCSGFYGQVSLSRLIEISLARSAFHLRRIYKIMREDLGIEPRHALADAELQALGAPAQVAD